jgi:hypothetical protein
MMATPPWSPRPHAPGAPTSCSGNLCSRIYLELLHHQWKTPLAVRPVFLKSPKRVEVLLALLQLALTAYQLLKRLYRQQVAADAAVAERRMTSESLLRQFRVYGLIVCRSPVGRVVYAARLTSRQRHILQQLPLHHARPDPRPPTTSATVRLAPPADAASHRRSRCGKIGLGAERRDRAFPQRNGTLFAPLARQLNAPLQGNVFPPQRKGLGYSCAGVVRQSIQHLITEGVFTNVNRRVRLPQTPGQPGKPHCIGNGGKKLTA